MIHINSLNTLIGIRLAVVAVVAVVVESVKMKRRSPNR